jgi:hypothetical protein
MAEPHVISALVKKRSELRGDIIHYKELIASLDKDLATIDNTIKIFDPDYNISSIKPLKKHRNRYFDTGEAKVLILNTLRELGIPTKTDDLAKSIASKKDLVFNSYNDERSFNKSIINVLGTLEKNSLVERTGKEGLTLIWKIKEIE